MRPEFFKMAENRVEANAHRGCGRLPASAIHGHINDFLVRTGLRSGVSELQLPCFTAVRAEIALMSGSVLVTHTPSVAEQEGQLIETEALEHLKNTSYTNVVGIIKDFPSVNKLFKIPINTRPCN